MADEQWWDECPHRVEVRKISRDDLKTKPEFECKLEQGPGSPPQLEWRCRESECPHTDRDDVPSEDWVAVLSQV